MRDPKSPQELSPQTLAIRGAQLQTEEMSHSEALFMTSSFCYESAEQAAARFERTEEGNIYSRFINPTVGVFEKRVALLEGAERGVAFASGMAAITALMMSLLQAGDHVILSRSIFGTTTRLFSSYLAKFGIEFTQVDIDRVDQWQAALQGNTKMLFLESPSNPLTQIADIAALAELAHGIDARLVVDNTFCSPVFQQPLRLGADIVMHSATKYIDGQGRALGGILVGNEADMEEVHMYLRTSGASLSPFNAWVFIKGLDTLALRMQAHDAATLELAHWLREQPGIAKVHYIGLEDHPQYRLAQRQQSGFGAVMAFAVEDAKGQASKQAAWDFINATQWLTITSNLGDSKTTLTHPGSTSHGKLTPEARAEAGIAENLIRISVGLEAVADIKAELTRGLAALGHQVD